RQASLARFALAGQLVLLAGSPAAATAMEVVVPDVATLARQEPARLPPPPAWRVGTAAGLWRIEDVMAQFRAASSRPPPINHVRSAFVRPDLAWLRAYIAWFGHLRDPLQLRFSDEQFDCDKYSRCFAAFADLLAMQAGETRAPIAVGWAIVYNAYPFAGISAGISHSVVVVGTTDGVYVVEPQNGEMVPLAEYPNRDSLLAVYL
ncbi:MAG: hypothetical protein JSR48_09500, partial [Verrucomicrobia bacterium]|nr:hypothetical protein [Verrucomicrobiota bacterium]